MAGTDTHSKGIGYVLWIFGFTGSHRFYFGKPVSGTIWLLTGGLLGVGWLIDLFLIPSLDRQAARNFTPGKYDYTVAWLLQTFLGPLGIHKFYLGNVGMGLLWLFTAGLFGLGWIYDFWTLNDQVSAANQSSR